MHKLLSIALLGATALVGLVNAECCYPFCTPDGCFCRDNTLPTPYCGYGPCNIFGCDCTGGCRREENPAKRKRTTLLDPRSESTTEMFKAANTAGDGKLTLPELLAWATAGKDGANETEWANYFQGFDRGNKGYVTVDEAHRPVGA